MTYEAVLPETEESRQRVIELGELLLLGSYTEATRAIVGGILSGNNGAFIPAILRGDDSLTFCLELMRTFIARWGYPLPRPEVSVVAKDEGDICIITNLLGDEFRPFLLRLFELITSEDVP